MVVSKHHRQRPGGSALLSDEYREGQTWALNVSRGNCRGRERQAFAAGIKPADSPASQRVSCSVELARVSGNAHRKKYAHHLRAAQNHVDHLGVSIKNPDFGSVELIHPSAAGKSPVSEAFRELHRTSFPKLMLLV